MKRLIVLFLFVSATLSAQYSINGTMSPMEDYKWILLYKIEGSKQVFIKNTQVKKDGEKGVFKLSLPADSEIGFYRIKYRMKKNEFIDFLFNKENIDFEFNPKNAENSIVFNTSEENKIYTSFKEKIFNAQYTLDSIQSEYFRNPTSKIKGNYRNSLKSIQKIESKYRQDSQNKIVHHFIKASLRYNTLEITENPVKYINNTLSHFFDNIDFSNNILYNSSFLFDKVSEYVFSLNYAADPNQKQEVYKKAVQVVIEKIKPISFKADIINYLISKFAETKNAVLVDYIFANYFEKLPQQYQNLEFKNKILAQLRVAIGRVAPDFSWTEKGKNLSLSELKDGLSYLIIFYSTECSHCLREVPKVYEFMKGMNNTKVIAFAMETSEKTWINYQFTMPRWHHVLGLKKWQNTTARTYLVNSTPTYFLLGMDKKIISIPENIDELKMLLKELN
jgi:thiol-disulfide isomerase/thioredoxin